MQINTPLSPPTVINHLPFSQPEPNTDNCSSDNQSLDSGSDNDNDFVRTKKPKHKKQRPLNEAISDILSSKPRAKSLVPILSRTIIERKLAEDQLNEQTQKHISRLNKIEYAKEHAIPNADELNYEVQLRKVATRGVVKLFNAVRLAQHKVRKIKSDDQSVIPSSDVKEKVLSTTRSAFMDILRRPRNDQPHIKSRSVLFSQQPSSDVQDRSGSKLVNDSDKSNQGTWSVLEDNYMLNAKLKDWECEQEDEMEF